MNKVIDVFEMVADDANWMQDAIQDANDRIDELGVDWSGL